MLGIGVLVITFVVGCVLSESVVAGVWFGNACILVIASITAVVMV